MKRKTRIVLLAVMLAAIAGFQGGFHEWTPPAHATTTTITPTKIAIIVAENKPWSTVNSSSNAAFFRSLIGGTANGLSIDPSPSNCDYPTADGAGTDGTTACTAGMFQSFRKGTTGKLTGASAPEYAFLAAGSDMNIRDRTEPCGAYPSTSTSCTDPWTVGNPEKGTAGYAPGHNNLSDPVYDIFGYMDANSIGYTVYAEDYLGDGSTCDTSFSSDGGDPSNFYARKHNSFLQMWDNSPDAILDYTKTSGGVTTHYTPTSNSNATSRCTAHMRDFPGNTPNASTAPIQNFDGSQTFGPATYIFPSMCHMGHNANNPTCGGDSTHKYGGLQGFDNWLSLNIDGIRESVGQTGVVVVTYDESGDATGNGFAPPVATLVLPGTDGSGTPGVLHAGEGSYTGGTFDMNSTLKAALAVVGTDCSILDDTVIYNNAASNAVSGQDACTAAAELPVDLDVTDTTPAIVQQATNHTTTNSASASATWPAATTANDFLVAAVGYSGAPSSITAPSGWVLAKDKTKNVSLYVCANCASHSGTETWTANAAFANVVVLEEWSNISTGATIDKTANATSGSDDTPTTALSGTTATTTTANEIVLAGLYNGSHSTFSNATAGYNVVQDGQTSGSGIQIALLTQIVSATGAYAAQADYTTANRYRGAIATYTR